MTDTLNRAPNQEYYDRVAALSTVPFWQLGEMHEPSGPERPHVWHWDEVVPELLRSQHLESEATGELQRRALLLRNPGLAPPAFGATPTLVAAYQMLLPGESAPVHAHSFSALRFGASGGEARMVVDGHRVPMHPGDLVLTPAWCWHGHVHAGGDEPVVWFDGLDVPLLVALRAGFYRDPSVSASTSRRSATRRAPRRRGSASCPPVSRPTVTRRSAAIPGTRPIRPSSACWPCPTAMPCSSTATRSPAGQRWRRSPARCAAWRRAPARRGGGRRRARCGSWREAPGRSLSTASPTTSGLNDVIAVPAWRWHEIRAGHEELVLFEISDRPVHDALGLFRAEVA